MTPVSALVQVARRDGTGTAVAPASGVPPGLTRRRVGEAVRVCCVTIQFGLLVLLVRLLDIERGLLGDVLVLAWLGFAVHHYLPLRLRLPFFTLLSMASILVAVGIRLGAFVLLAGLVLIAICHAPWRFYWRVLALVVLAGVLLAFRITSLAPPVVVLASMFMFRIVVYLYDHEHRTAPFSFFRATSYFFMLPNVCFPHFPLVDYKTFCTTHYNAEPIRIYQTGLRWMLRGLLHLILYRALYQFAQVDPLTVTDLGGAARFMVTTFLLYLRVSGQFHLVVGILHLFGFNLPETHHLYLLSSSFLDLWRRINIYWKDFILKIFFNPAYFACKRFGPTRAVVLATVYAFFWTWLLHDYQWLWLRGAVTFSWQNLVFWALLGGLVLASALWEMKRSRQRAKHKMQRTFRSEIYRALCTIATFVTICTLWTLWSCQSADELGRVLLAATNVTLPSALAVCGGLAALGLASVLFGRSVQERNVGSISGKPGAGDFAFWPSASLVTAAALGLLLFSAIPSIPAPQDTMLGEVVVSLKKDRLNEMDVNARTRGYYEELDVSRQDVAVAMAIHSDHWPATKLHAERNDFMLHEPIPGNKVEYRGKIFEFNSQGMRGPLYTQAKPEGVFRIALVGTSHEIGRGVNEEETFARLLESRLNRDDTDARTRKFEVLNFSVEGYGAIQKLYHVRDSVLAFDPDLVMFVTYRREAERTADQLARALGKGYEFPEPFETSVRAACAEAHVDGATAFTRIERQLMPHLTPIVDQAFQQFAAICKERGVRGCFVYRPEVAEFVHLQAAQRRQVLDLAQRTGLPVLDLSGSFASIPVPKRESLMVEPLGTFDWRTLRREGIDDHPNERAHELLAEELYRQLHAPEGRGLLEPP